MIDDYDSLQKENITIESYTKEFNINNEKTIKLKETIENEINQIDTLYNKINKEVTDSFIKKHEKLIKEENDLKEKLQNETTQTKEKLENFLSEVNKLIKISERINKGIKTLEKEEKNMFTTMSYVSKINVNQKEMKKIFQELMSNIKMCFKEEETNIKYEQYYFNGIQIPKDIEFKNITSNSFEINWKIDDINLINIDKKRIKYRIEIRKENKNAKFNNIYEGNNTKYVIDHLDNNSYYEIRICSTYNDLIGYWSQIKTVKTLEYDSIILRQSQRGEEFLKKIYEWTGFRGIELLYRGSRDGSTSNIFHEKCDNKGETLCLYKNDKGYIFGGYASIPWKSSGKAISAPDCFIFTLTNIYGIEPTKFINSNTSQSIYHNSNYGPSFGNYNDINITQDYKSSGPYCHFPYDYKDSTGKGKSLFTGDSNNNNDSLVIKEIEVFKLYK